MERARSQSVELMLIVPTSLEAGGPASLREAAAQAARRRLRGALARFRAAGLYVREAGVEEGGPDLAVADAVAGGDVDEIVVATRPRRLRRGHDALAERLRDATGLPVTRVVGRAARERVARRTPAGAAGRSRGQEPRRGRPAARSPAEAPRPSAAWVRSREPLPRLSPLAVVRLQLARGLAVMGFVLLALAVAGATNT